MKYPPADGPTVSDHSRIEWTESTWIPGHRLHQGEPGLAAFPFHSRILPRFEDNQMPPQPDDHVMGLQIFFNGTIPASCRATCRAPAPAREDGTDLAGVLRGFPRTEILVVRRFDFRSPHP